MNLQELERMWSNDSKIDRAQLAHKSLEIPFLHGKYYKLFIQERMVMFTLSQKLDTLKLEKYEFYTQGPTSETPDDWQLPDSGRLRVKGDVGRYLDGDPHIQELEFKLNLQTEKVKFIESILGALKTMNFNVKNALDVMKFEAGA